MKRITSAGAVIAFMLSLFLFSSCRGEHFITDAGYRAQVEADYRAKLDALGGSDVTTDVENVVGGLHKIAEKEALMFLFAYMPLPDIAGYDGDLWIDGVRTAFKAREEMPWGKSVPEKVFRHFVLPLRVNNENLDGARPVFYDELKDRVKGLSMYDAVLEVNHWCHEKVVYSPSDARTSAPLATLKTGWGRCGEESVFAVAAFRAVGIPARQVYTPRWAHTDDNHAWVEVWVDGVWHYLGACEPEPELDVAWFSSTVLRGMLEHSKVFGRYIPDDEDIIAETQCFTEINVTSNYAPVGRVQVTVTDTSGNAVQGAKVEYKIYNYADLYSAITSRTDGDGHSSATFGIGDIVVWASKDGTFGFSKVTVEHVGGVTSVSIPLSRRAGDFIEEAFDLVPPVARTATNNITGEQAAENVRRKAEEDSIRAIYTSTFPKEGNKYVLKAYGNYDEIEKFLESVSGNGGADPEDLLELLNEKDLRDTPCEILLDHFNGFLATYSRDKPQWKYVLNPRVATEILSPYRGYFTERYGHQKVEEIIAKAKEIKVLDDFNPQRIPATPVATDKLGAADSYSLNIWFVAICRSSGIPARIERVSGKLQYHDGKVWHNVSLGNKVGTSSSGRGCFELEYTGQKGIDDPRYEIHFTVSKVRDDGSMQLLDFSNSEGSLIATWKSSFSKPVEIEAGSYLLTSGVRMASGKVLVALKSFEVKKDGNVKVPLVLREDISDLQVIGSMNPEDHISLIDLSDVDDDDEDTESQSILETTGRGYFALCFVKSGDEPSNHILQSFLGKKPKYPVVIMYRNKHDYRKVDFSIFPPAPDNVSFGIDGNWEIRNRICKEMDIDKSVMPIVVIGDTFGRIVYVSQGYEIGTADILEKL